MPPYQLMLERANALFNREQIGQIDGALFDAPGSLDDLLAEVGICKTDREAEHVRGWPDGIKEALRAAVRSAVSREPRMPITFSWVPGYDYELDIWEAAATSESIGAMTILIRSRYPGDRQTATSS